MLSGGCNYLQFRCQLILYHDTFLQFTIVVSSTNSFGRSDKTWRRLLVSQKTTGLTMEPWGTPFLSTSSWSYNRWKSLNYLPLKYDFNSCCYGNCRSVFFCQTIVRNTIKGLCEVIRKRHDLFSPINSRVFLQDYKELWT